jgi:hypothetical protein
VKALGSLQDEITNERASMCVSVKFHRIQESLVSSLQAAGEQSDLHPFLACRRARVNV